MYCNQGFKNIDCGPELNNIYLYTLLKHNTEYLNSLGRGATFKEISAKIVSGIRIPAPPRKQQDQFEDFVRQVDKSKAICKQIFQSFDNLVKSRFIEMIKSCDYPLKTIGEVCINTRVGPFGSALHKQEMAREGPVFVLGTDNAVDNSFNVYEKRFISAEKYAELERYTVLPGDIIITMMGTIGRTAVIPYDFMTAIISSHLSCLTVDRTLILPDFMQKCMVMDIDVSSHLNANKKGSIMNGLNLKIIKSIPIVCPPIDVQKEFLSFVEQVDKSKFEVVQSLLKLKDLKSSE